MPTAKKLPSGSWRCQVFSHYEEKVYPDGTIKKKRIYRSFTCDIQGPQGKRRAEKDAANWAEKKERHKDISDITFYNALDEYIANRESVLSPRTLMDYKRTRDKHLQSLRDIRVSLITLVDIQKAINIEAEKLSPKTVRNIHGLISAVMRIYRPDFKLNTSLPKKVRPNLYTPSDSDIQALIRTVQGTEMEVPVLLAAFGPLRRGEICALDASDVSGNVIHVHNNMVRQDGGGWVIKSPKSYAGDRYVEFPEVVIAKLNTSGRITNLNPDIITHRFQYVMKKAGVQHFRFHDLRHYAASILHSLNVPDIYIARRGGWGNLSTLNNIYKHALDEKEKDMDKIANDHFTELCNTKCNTK